MKIIGGKDNNNSKLLFILIGSSSTICNRKRSTLKQNTLQMQ